MRTIHCDTRGVCLLVMHRLAGNSQPVFFLAAIFPVRPIVQITPEKNRNSPPSPGSPNRMIFTIDFFTSSHYGPSSTVLLNSSITPDRDLL